MTIRNKKWLILIKRNGLENNKKYIEMLKNMIKRLKIRNQKGATAVEFALILPILVMMLFGIFQFGIVYNNWIALTHAAREGARLAAVGAYSEQAVMDSAPSVTIGNINISGQDGNIGDPVTVTVQGTVLDVQIPFVGGWPIQLESTATMRIEQTE